jgi:hypothetical protein
MCGTGEWFLHHNNSAAHSVLSVQEFLARNCITAVLHHPYSLDLAPCDFFLFPHLKLALKGRRFDIIIAIQKELQATDGSRF